MNKKSKPSSDLVDSKSTLRLSTRRKSSRKSLSKKSTESISTQGDEGPWADFEEFTGNFSTRNPTVLSRTAKLLLDHRQFKAARTVQAAVRGWLARRRYDREKRAAMTIQREFRGFFAKRKYYNMLEAELQKRMEAHYNRSAQIIQALWRGWWVRENIHDHYRLSRMQKDAAEDLLHCVAFKLHHLLRTCQIPGIYSLRNSNCLSKVEQLLAALSFKQHNDRVRKARAEREAKINEAKKHFHKSGYCTEVPYAGPNFLGYCESPCCELYQEEDADKKMHKILSLYERAARVDSRLAKIHSKQKRRSTKKSEKSVVATDFCADVVKSMKRWKILSASNRAIDPHIFRKPENIENFLNEIQSLQSLMDERCHCKKSLSELRACKV